MTEPAHRVLSLVAGMLSVDRAAVAAYPELGGYPAGAESGAAGPDPVDGGSVGINDPDRAARIAAIAAECGGEVA